MYLFLFHDTLKRSIAFLRHDLCVVLFPAEAFSLGPQKMHIMKVLWYPDGLHGPTKFR
jgi:hypothetical protein